MPVNHTVKQGEYLSLIAERYGFSSYKSIWDDPANADLKQKRQNPSVLLPDDQLVIPDKGDKSESRPTGARHKFVASGDKLMLRLTVKDESGQPVKNAACVLDVDGTTLDLKTDGQGKVEHSVPRSARQGRLILIDDALPIDLNLPIGVGELDPLDTVTGQIARLNNLGYDAGLVQEPADDDAKDQLRSAMEEFQCNAKITVDGKCGPQTRAALKQAFGC